FKFRIILQIKDRGEGRYKKNLSLLPEKWNKFSIPIDDVAASINEKKIADLNFFRWNPKNDVTVYFDNIRLISPGFEKADSNSETSTATKNKTTGYSDDIKYKVKKNVLAKPGNSFSFILENPTLSSVNSYPWTGIVQLPKKKLANPTTLALKSPSGTNLPFQYRILNRWDDGSVKNILIDFQPTIEPKRQKVYSLFWGENINDDVSQPVLNIQNLDDKIQINTGNLKFIINKTHFNLFDTVWLDSNGDNIFGNNELITENCDIIISYSGNLFKSSLDYTNYTLKIIESGKMRTCILAQGYLKSATGQSLCKFETVFNIFAGKNFVEINQNFIFPKHFPVESALFLTPFPSKINQIYSPNTGVQMNLPVMLFQSDMEKCEVRYGGRQLSFDKNLSDWVDASNSSTGITIALSPNWNLPQKGYYVDKNKLATYLWAPVASELDMKNALSSVGKQSNIVRLTGIKSSHDLLFYFHKEDMAQIETKETANAFLNPLFIP
ncbi:MAG: hypothetical protein U9P79_08685, partial [Candidatus Cloacimonadota bacterium]|nr:hypothetical protein [Candidatus Cloacimonadota bacterium]